MKAWKNRIGLRRGDVLVLCFFLVLSAVLFCADFARGEAVRAVIYADGEAVGTVDLAAVGEPYAFSVGGCTLSVTRGAIAFADADCPDRRCVQRGRMTRPGDCMACLPNRVTVVLIGSGGVDAVTG